MGAVGRQTHVTALALAPTTPEVPLDREATFEQLYAAHWRRLVRLAVLLLRDQGRAEEVVQDAFVAVHDRWRTLRDPAKAAAYLRTSVVNRARSELRHRGVEERYAARQSGREPLEAPADVPLLAADRRSAVLTALQQLPTRQREVLALRHYLELSEAEIADTLGISRGSVKAHASRGAATLRTLLEKDS
jgi:RNA polymerase sigma-70 factor (sigma-E family)